MVENLFDVNCGMLGRKAGRTDRLLPEELLDLMKSCRITGALVRNLPTDSEADFRLSNSLLYKACADHPELHPCPVVAPSVPGDGYTEADQVGDALEHGVKTVWIRPAQDYWQPRVWSAGPLFQLLQEHRLPVLLSCDVISYDHMNELAGAFYKLPFIITGAGYRDLRSLMPLFGAHGNLSLSVGTPFSVHCGLEYLVQQIGVQRLLFGTGLPDADPAAAAAQLAWAAISDGDRRLAGAENYLKLAGGVTA